MPFSHKEQPGEFKEEWAKHYIAGSMSVAGQFMPNQVFCVVDEYGDIYLSVDTWSMTNFATYYIKVDSVKRVKQWQDSEHRERKLVQFDYEERK